MDADSPDVAPYCGDGLCGGEESAELCPADCAAVCGDGACTHDEDPLVCPDDCEGSCGDGFCGADEDVLGCPVDCCTGGTWSGTYRLSTSADMAALASYMVVEGDLLVVGSALPHLRGLVCLAEVTGDFTLAGNPDLGPPGLHALRSVGGVLSIGLEGAGNPRLTGLSGLDHLVTVGGLQVLEEDLLFDLRPLYELAEVTGPECLTIAWNPTLENVDGLESLARIGGCAAIHHNDRLYDVLGLASLVESGSVEVSHNRALSRLDGLSSLRVIAGDLTLRDNQWLGSVTGLMGLTRLDGDMVIEDNPALPTCQALALEEHLLALGWTGLSSISGNDDVSPCP